MHQSVARQDEPAPHRVFSEQDKNSQLRFFPYLFEGPAGSPRDRPAVPSSGERLAGFPEDLIGMYFLG